MNRNLAIISMLVASWVWAGENRFLGRLTSTGTSINNASTAAPFAIPPGAKITIYCDAASRVLVDNPSTAASGATTGVPVAAATLFPTSVGRANGQQISGVASAQIAMISVSGTANCDVWQRDGNE